MRPMFALLLALGGSLVVSSPVLAQEGQQIEVTKLFMWATASPPNWALGGLFAGLGLVGGLVTIFTLIGGAIPGTAGQAKIDTDSKRLDIMSEKLQDIITSPRPEPAVIAAIGIEVNNLRDDLRTERWKQFAVAGFLYAVLGAFFAALLAQDLLQALLVGAGWTGVLGALGLKTDHAERKSAKNSVMEKMEQRIKQLEAALKTETGKTPESLGLESFDVVARDFRVAQRL